MARPASNMNLYWKSAENFDLKWLPRNVNTAFPLPPPQHNSVFLELPIVEVKKK